MQLDGPEGRERRMLLALISPQDLCLAFSCTRSSSTLISREGPCLKFFTAARFGIAPWMNDEIRYRLHIFFAEETPAQT